jgi:hypothetical protein
LISISILLLLLLLGVQKMLMVIPQQLDVSRDEL